MTTSDESSLEFFERKVLLKIYGPLQVENTEYPTQAMVELYEIYGEIDIKNNNNNQKLSYIVKYSSL